MTTEPLVRPEVLALDLEGTLVSNAVSQLPRPGLYVFLEWCHAHFSRLVIYTAVRGERARSIASLLAGEGSAPPWFAGLECVAWHGAHKDASFVAGVRPEAVWLLDDLEQYVAPGQHAQWVPIAQFAPPYPDDDRGLEDARVVMAHRLAACGPAGDVSQG